MAVAAWCLAIGVTMASTELSDALRQLDSLDRAIMTVEYQELSLRTIADDLDRRLPVRLRVDWDSLNAIEIKPMQPLTLRVSQASASTVLNGLCLLLNNDFGRVVAEPFGGQIVLTSSRGAASLRFTEFYDVRDLVIAESARNTGSHPDRGMPGAPSQIRPDEQPDPPSAVPVEPSAPDGIAPQREPPRETAEPEPTDPPTRSRRQRPPNPNLERLRQVLDQIPPQPDPAPAERLMLMLTEHVDPDSWIRFGGDRAEYAERDHVIILTAPAGTHRRFASALAQLRAALPTGVSIDAEIRAIAAASWSRLRSRHADDQAALAREVRADAGGRPIWTTHGNVALDATLAAESSAEGATVHVEIAPAHDESRGRLTMGVKASIELGSARRALTTTVLLDPAPAAPVVVLELPPMAGDSARTVVDILVISVRRQ